jgi:tetratricopeptide (TPR) repeat protein/polysaccharide pyruvyl transferase WcaK-like protein
MKRISPPSPGKTRVAAVNEMLARAVQCHRAGRLTEAEDMYRRLLRSHPGYPEVLRLLGMLAIQTGRNEEAECLLSRAIETGKSEAQCYANLAVALQNLGRNEDAIEAGMKALSLAPENAAVCNTLGNAYRSLGLLETSAAWFKRAYALSPRSAEICVNLGNAYFDMNDLDEAAQWFRRAVTLNADNAEGHFRLGVIHRMCGRAEMAVESFLRALQIRPDFTEAYNGLGNSLSDLKELDAAAEAYRQALQCRSDYVEAHYNLGNVLAALDRNGEAAAHYECVVSLKPDFVEGHIKLGHALTAQGSFDRACLCYGEALSRNPSLAEAHNGLGNALRGKRSYDEALASYGKALSLRPDFAETYYNMSNVFLDMGNTKRAVECCEKSIAIKPDLPEPHRNLAAAWLTDGEFRRGWKKYEWRFFRKGESPPPFSSPRWDGTPLTGRTILVAAEQGVGDEIMFASCLPEVIDQAGRCIVECDGRLVPLFTRSFPQARVIARVGDESQLCGEHIDVHVPIGSLPMHFRTDLISFPVRRSYLTPDPELAKGWHTRYRGLGEGLKVGISWRGGKEVLVRLQRSTALPQWQKVFSVPSVQFINLQYGACEEELKAMGKTLGVTIHDWDDADPLRDLDGFAAQIAALDLVISVDNATVHMAGALGVPVWVLLPFSGDWRWMREYDDTPWYPAMRLFRQDAPGEWHGPFARVASLLSSVTNSSRDLLVPPPSKGFALSVKGDRLSPGTRRTAVFLNDTTHWYHWGCTGTSTAIYQSLSEKGYSVCRVPVTASYHCRNTPQSVDEFDSPECFRAFARTNPNLIREIAGGDVIVINGEGSLHGGSSYAMSLLYLAYSSKTFLGKHVQIINHSCYPENSGEYSETALWDLYRKVYASVDFSAIREPASLALLQRAGIPAMRAFDCLPLFMANHYSPRVARNPKKVVIGGSVALRPTHVQSLALYIDHLHVLGNEVHVLTGASLLPAADDEEFVRRLGECCPQGWSLARAGTMEAWLDTIASADLLVSGRFHHTIAAYALGTPFILLGSNTPKNLGIATAFGAPPPIPLEADDLVQQLIERTSVNRSGRGSAAADEYVLRLQMLTDLAQRNFDAL